MNEDNPTLRFARRDHAQAIAEMSRDLIETGLGWQYGPERIRRLLADPETVTLVAGEDVRPIGFAIMSFGDERAHLVLLAVHPAHRRRGVAGRMLQWLAASAKAAGMASLNVELREDNAPAHALYRAAGFTETLRLPGYYRGRETAVRMIRVLRMPGATTPR